MTRKPTHPEPAESRQELPWYRYPWPWVAIAIPGVAVIGGFFTLYLAVSNPDPLVLEEPQYDQVRAELKADPAAIRGNATEPGDGDQR